MRLRRYEEASHHPAADDDDRCRVTVASVSVVAQCHGVDAWVTALLVAGESNGLALAEVNGLDALFIFRHGEDLLELPMRKFVSRQLDVRSDC